MLVSFIVVVQKNKFRGETSVKTCLFSIARNIWLNELKKREKRFQRELIYQRAEEITEMETNYFIGMRESKQEVMNLVEQPDETCKTVLVMFYYENFSIKEMPKKLGIPVNRR